MPRPAEFPYALDLRSLIIDGRRVPRRGVVGSPFAFISPTLGRIDVDVGFVTDFASVPRGLWNLYPPDGDYTDAAVIHDWLYRHQATSATGEFTVTREQADNVFLEAMTVLGIRLSTRRVLFRGVRIGGEDAWEENARAKAGLPPKAAAPRARRPVNFPKSRR
jgi:hypothetical protein